MNKLTMTLEEEDLVALLFGAAQSSCAFCRKHLTENQMWQFDCCDYNEPLYKAVKQIDLEQLEDEHNRAYFQEVLETGKGFYNEHL